MSEEVPYIAVGNDEMDRKTIWSTCPRCGSRIEFTVGEFLRCAHDEGRPRPTCPGCGRAVEIGKAVRFDG